jgi:glycolate oxidase FAD binding subunit
MMSAPAWQAAQPRLEELVASLPAQLSIVGRNSKHIFNPPIAAPLFSTRHWSGIIEHDVEDQVVVVWAGTPLRELQDQLRVFGQCLALPQTGHALIDGVPGTVGGLIAANLPHGLSSQTRSPKDWTLGITLIRADGGIARAGTKAVKSVAGYDIHRFMAGARGTLGLIAVAAFRLHPLRGLPVTRAEALQPWNGEPVWIQRVAPGDYDVARATAIQLFAADPDSSTLWHAVAPFRFTNDWVLGPAGEISPQSAPPELAAQARVILDPHRRFNPHIEP